MVKKDLTKIFIDEVYSTPPRKNYPNKKTIIKSIDDIWSSDLLDMNDYGLKNNRGYRYILIVIDIFSKFGWTILLKNKYAQSLTDAFSEFIKSSNGKPNVLETDDGKEYIRKIFNEFSHNHKFKKYPRSTALGAVSARRFNRTVRNLPKKPILEKGKADWISELPSVIKQYNNTIHSSLKMTPSQARKKVKEKLVYSKFQDKRKILKPNIELGQLVRTADIRRVLVKAIQQIIA